MKRTRIRSISDKRKARLAQARTESRQRLVRKKKVRKPLAKSNPEKQAKRRKSYAQKLAAYKRSETYKVVEARAEGRCEFSYPAVVDAVTGKQRGSDMKRCPAYRRDGSRLTHHHKTYARFGGKELPEDIEVLCRYHNEEAESQHPTRNRNYRKSA